MQSFNEECWEADVDQAFTHAEIVTSNHVRNAEVEAAQASLDSQAAQSRLLRIVSRKEELLGEVKTAELTMKIRKRADDSVTIVGSVVIATLVVIGLVSITCHLIGLPVGFWVFPVLLSVSPIGYFGIKLFTPDDATLKAAIDSCTRELQSLQGELESAQNQFSSASATYNLLNTTHHNLLQKFNSRINRLRSAKWEFLQGVPFEKFLEAIFIEWGYEVSTTKVTGDQGVDLIVAKNGLKVAIQAKGYPGSTVGNSAVQEADTGMRFYQCHRSAVITNSTFTSAARKLADGVGCKLVDRDMIPLLIEGKIDL
jgi:HJR/Mrr/RecB family endonuclease